MSEPTEQEEPNSTAAVEERAQQNGDKEGGGPGGDNDDEVINQDQSAADPTSNGGKPAPKPAGESADADNEAGAGSSDRSAAAQAQAGGRRKMFKPKMDFAKALSIMGFSTSRTLDPSGGHDAKVELNAALSRKMADIEKRKRAANKKEQTKVEDKLRDEIRTLHEAYQFLSKKYIKLAETMAETKVN